MYVGPWEEYRILKAIENHREKTERMGQDPTRTAKETTLAITMWGPDADRSSSHHFPPILEGALVQDTPLIDSPVSSHVGVSSATSRARMRNKKSQPKTTLRFLMRVRDVDVYTEEEVVSTPSVKSSESADTLSCSGGASEGRRLKLHSNKINTERNTRQVLPTGVQLETTEGGPAVPMHVHVELGTGRVIRKPQLLVTSNVSGEEASCPQSSDVSRSSIRGNQQVVELLRGFPLDTKSKYIRAGQPLPERQTLKHIKKQFSIGEEELERQIERRLHLQMLYSGNYISDDVSRAEGDEPLKGKEQQMDQQENRKGLTFAEPLPGVPWDLHIPHPTHPSLISAGTPGLSSGVTSLPTGEKREQPCLRVGSPVERARRIHPYDVGAPIAPPIEVPFTSLKEVTTPLGTVGHGFSETMRSINISRGGSSCTSSRHMDRPSTAIGMCRPTLGYHAGTSQVQNHLSRAAVPLSTEVSQSTGVAFEHASHVLPLQVCDAPPAMVADPLDDDTVGALINWAEQLDPDNIF